MKYETRNSFFRKLKLDPCLSPCISINSKWIKDLNIICETLRLVQERAGNILELIGIGTDFLNRTQLAQQLRERIDKWNYVKLKKLHNKRNGNQIEEAGHRMGEKSLPALHLTRD
jgi:hypothetical protein